MLAAAWRSYGQRYLACWAGYWGAYAVAWPLFSLFYRADGAHQVALASLLGGLASLFALGGRALFVLGTVCYMEWRKPSRRNLLAGAAVILAIAIAGEGARFAVGRGSPGWLALPFRTFTIGGIAEFVLGIAVLRGARGSQSMPRRILGIALFVSGLSDAWDFFSEAVMGPVWSEGITGLRISVFVSQITDALVGAGMLVAAIGTERERAERALEELRRRDEHLHRVRKIEAAGQLAGGLAHDFNNLLTIIVANLDFLRPRLTGDAQALGDVDAAAHAADRAAQLTRQLLTFARRQKVEPRATNLNDTIHSVDRMLAALLGERIERCTRLQPGPLPVFIDSAQIEQVLVNLIVNARDAMPRGGRVTLQTATASFPRDARPPEASEVPDGDWVMLAVEDTGEGMGAETRQRIFEPFFTTKALGKGTGLGLATVFGIVQESGGHIGVRSAPGEGSRFAVYLPRHAGALTERSKAARAGRGRAERVLLVENEAGVRSVAARALTAHGYSVLEAEGGPEALRRGPEALDEVALAVVDVVMPEMDGWELARALRLRRPRHPVLFISGYVPNQSTAELPGEPSSFLAKPFTPEQLVARVREMLDS